jgi:hypothetical protein
MSSPIACQTISFSSKLGRVSFCCFQPKNPTENYPPKLVLSSSQRVTERSHPWSCSVPALPEYSISSFEMTLWACFHATQNMGTYKHASTWTQNNITSSISWLFTGLGYKCQKTSWLFPKIKFSFTGWGSATIVLIPNNVASIWRKVSWEPQRVWDNGGIGVNIWHLWWLFRTERDTHLDGHILPYILRRPSHYQKATLWWRQVPKPKN